MALPMVVSYWATVETVSRKLKREKKFHFSIHILEMKINDKQFGSWTKRLAFVKQQSFE